MAQFFVILSSYLLMLGNVFSQGKVLNNGCNSNHGVTLKSSEGGFWSISSTKKGELTANSEGKLYVGHDAAMFCMVFPGLEGSNYSTSLQLFGHPNLFVNVRPDNEIYLDKVNGILQFNTSASFKLWKFQNQSVILESFLGKGLYVALDPSYALTVGAATSYFNIINPENLDVLDSNVGFLQSGWWVESNTAIPQALDVESIISSPTENLTTIVNILSFVCATGPNSFHRLQGYFRPYFDNLFIFSVACKSECKLLIEQANRTVRQCSGTTECGPIFLYGGPSHAYYYVELLVFPGFHGDHVALDIYIDDGENLRALKFAEFKKIDYGREAHRWIFPYACNQSCMDELQLASLTITNTSGVATINGTSYFGYDEIYKARGLILNFANLPSKYEAGFSIGFWFEAKRKFNVSEKPIIWSDSVFQINYKTMTTVFQLTFSVMFDSSMQSLTVKTRHYGVKHFIFTWSSLKGLKCFRDGRLVKKKRNSSVSTFKRGASKLFIGYHKQQSFNMTELVFWRSALTCSQSREEFQVSCRVYPSTCRWQRKKSSESNSEWLVKKGTVPSYPFTGPPSTPEYTFYMEASGTPIYSRASLKSPRIAKHFKCLRFAYFMFGDGVGQLMVVRHSLDNSREVLWLRAGQQQSRNWKIALVNISSTVEVDRISIEAVRGVSFRGDIAVYYMRFKDESCETTPVGAFPVLSYEYTRLNGCYNVINSEYLTEESFPNMEFCKIIAFEKGSIVIAERLEQCHAGLFVYKAFSNDSNQNSCNLTTSYSLFVQSYSCKSSCPSNYPCQTRTGKCNCDTRFANYLNENCLNDMKDSTYSNAVRFWPMDNILTDTVSGEKTDASLIIGVANKSILVGSTPLELKYNVITASTSRPTSRITSGPTSRPTSGPTSKHTLKPTSRPTLKPTSRHFSEPTSAAYSGLISERTYSVWIRIRKNTAKILSFVVDSTHIAELCYQPERSLLHVDVKCKNSKGICIIRNWYSWTPEIFYHVVFVLWNGQLQFYKNGVVQSEYIAENNVFCQSTPFFKNPTLFPGVAFDDIAVWHQSLSEQDVLKIYNRYTRYKTLDGLHSKQPVILDIEGIWTTKNILDEDGVVKEEIQREIFHELGYLGTDLQNIVATHSWNGTHSIASVKVFLSYSWLWHQWSIKYYTIKKSNMAGGFIVNHTLSSKYLSDAPSDLKAVAFNSTYCKLTWKFTPQEKLSPFERFLLYYGDGLDEWKVDVESTVPEAEIFSLSPFTEYYFFVAARHLIGCGFLSDPLYLRTNVSAPSAPPRNLHFVSQSPFTLTLFWDDVPQTGWNAPSVGYKVWCNQVSSSGTVNKTVELGYRNIILTGLRPMTPYLCNIWAFNEIGDGPGNTIMVTTTELDVKILSKTSRTITVQWNPRPSTENSILMLTYYSLSHTSAGNTTELNISGLTTVTIKDLRPYHLYGIVLKHVFFDDEEYCGSAFEIMTDEEVPSAPPQNVSVEAISSSSLVITWSTVAMEHRNGVILDYEIVLYDLLDNSSETILIDLDNGTQFILQKNGLKKYHSYSVQIAATTSVGCGVYSPWIGKRTWEDIPSAPPQNVSVEAISSSSLVITWSTVAMEHRNGVILGYEIVLYDLLDNLSEIILINNQTQFIFQKNGLKKYHSYSVQIAATTSVGCGVYSPWIEKRTLQDIPFAPPRNLSIKAISSLSLLITWSTVAMEHRNGVILGYEIVLYDLLDNSSESILISNQTQFIFQKNGLKKYHSYSVQIAATTSVGCGVYSLWIGKRTLEDIPSAPPQNVSVEAISSSSLMITWSTVAMEHRNGVILGYEIVLYDAMNNLSEIIFINNQSQFSFQKNGLKKYHSYSVQIAATTSVGCGVYSLWIGKRTLEDIPSAPPQNVSVEAISSSSLMITWSTVAMEHRNGVILGYEIVLYDAMNNLSEIIFINNQSQFSFQKNGLKKYHSYSVQIAATTSVGCGVYSPWIEKRTWEDIPSAPPQNVSIEAISSSSLLITWSTVALEHRNGVIFGYEIVLYDALDNSSETILINNQTQFSFQKNGLKKYHSYSVQIAATTSVGCGVYSPWIEKRTLQDIPSAPPQNVSVEAISSSSLLITWSTVAMEHRNGVILDYQIVLYDAMNNLSETILINSQSQFIFQKNGLKKYHSYSVQIAATTSVGCGVYSPWIEKRTWEDKPLSAPEMLLVSLSPLLFYQLTWKPMNATAFIGRPLGYSIMFGVNTTSPLDYSSVNVSYTESNFSFPKKLLTRFVYYGVALAAFTSVGKGPEIGLTFYVNDVPSSPPANVSVFSTSSKTLLVQWSPIPKQHGLAKGYRLLSYCISCETGSHTLFKTISALSTYYELSGLNIFSNYSIQLVAFSEFGRGNYSMPVFCRTGETEPEVAPTNVSWISTGPQNFTIFWSFVSATWGNIITYRVTIGIVYNKTFDDVRRDLPSRYNFTTFIGLQPNTEYAFRVRAATSKGFGPGSNLKFGQTLAKDAEICPLNVSLFNVTSRSVMITWLPLDPLLVPGGLTSYDIVYWIDQEGFPDDIHVVNTRSVLTSFHLEGLEESVTYMIRVQATIAHRGFVSLASCPAHNVTTEDDVPDASPLNVSKASVTSTSITLNWKAIPLSRMNGVLLGYRLNYSLLSLGYGTRRKRAVESEIFSVSLGPNVLSRRIYPLRTFTTYSVTIAGFNANGAGPYSNEIRVITGEDVPSRPPGNVRAVNYTGPTSLLLIWSPIPPQYAHGIITGYKVRYKAVGQGERKISGKSLEIEVSAEMNMVRITNLESYTRYQFSILAKTKVGNGVWSKLVFGETCRCHQTLSTNWWEIKPYMDISENTRMAGVFPIILQQMVKSCCQFCLAHKTSKLDFFSKASGELNDLGYFKKRSLEDVKSNISEDSDLSFPMYGSLQQEKYGALYGYIPLISSPGEALIVNREPKQSAGDVLLATVTNCWALFLLTLVFSILAGITIWILEYRSNPQHFPPQFLIGVYHGVWWAIVTSSTVGYGDRSPKTIGGRIFSVVWTLVGQVLILILTSTITRSLTSYSLTIDSTLYGKQVAAILNSPQYDFAIRRNAKVERVVCLNVEDMVSALKTRQVDGLIVDTYVAGARKEVFSEFFRVRKIFDHMSAYGVVLAGDAMKLRTCFTKYIKANQGSIYKEIRKVVAAIEEPPLSESVTRSTKLFDPESKHTKNSITICGIILAVLTILGLFYELIHRKRRKTKVKPLVTFVCEQKQMKDHFCQEVRIFVTKMKKLAMDLRTRHLDELRRLTRLKKADLKHKGNRIDMTELVEIGTRNRVSIAGDK